MNCPNCKEEVDIKKNTFKICTCGSTLICTQVGKKLIVDDVTPDKGEK